MGCIDEMNYEILLSKTSFKESSTFIRSNYDEVYIVAPGYHMFDVFIIGVPPIYIAIDDDFVIFPYTKPCHGTFVLTIHSPDEVNNLKKTAKPAK